MPPALETPLVDQPQAADGRGDEKRSVAVAVQRQGARSRAPRVTAKGEGAVAEQILAIAFERGVKVRTDADLAEILKAIEIDCEVPLEALAAVAEILSYVYRANAGSPDLAGAEPVGTEPMTAEP